MENKLVDKYLFCEKRLEEIKKVHKETVMYNYEFKDPKSFFLKLAYLYVYIFFNMGIGIYLLNRVSNWIEVNDLPLFPTAFAFVIMMLFIGVFINYIILKQLSKIKFLRKEIELKNIKKSKTTEEEKEKELKDILKLLSVIASGSLFPPAAIIVLLLYTFITGSFLSDYLKLIKDKKEYGRKVYLKNYSQTDKLEAKKKKYKEDIINNFDAVQFLYNNKNNEKYKELYKETIQKLRSDKEDSNIISEKFNKSVNNEKMRIHNY